MNVLNQRKPGAIRDHGQLRTQMYLSDVAAMGIHNPGCASTQRWFCEDDAVTETWTDSLWSEASAIYQAILDHPFLRGLTSGTLPPDRFGYYVAQDAHYLRDYARALAVVAGKAPTHAAAGMFARHSAATVDVELALHASLLPELGLDPADLDGIGVSPSTLSYTSYLLATVHGGSFVEGLAAILPCYWIYARVGAELCERGSPDPRYQRWIDTYAGEEFGTVVAEVLTFADLVGQQLGAAEAIRARQHFVTTARYEWMFWDAAWRLEQWPIIAAGAGNVSS
jgi:thiaminase (transcriptional activator TenA)